MTNLYSRPRGANITPVLAGAALVLAGYLVLDRAGVFDSGPNLDPRPVVPRGTLASTEQTTIDIFRRNAPSAVHISTLSNARSRFVDGNTRSTGSGIIWDEQGYVLTNHHVVKRARSSNATRILARLHNGKTYEASFVFSYEYLDLAIIKINDPPRNLQPAQLGTSGDLQVGQWVFAIGNPFGLEQTLTTGIISALDRAIKTGKDVELGGLIQVDAAINPGNSGGLLLDSSGRLIGMNTAIYSQTGESAGIGFAVPIDRINKMVPRLMAQKPPIQAGLGIEARNWPYNLLSDVGFGYGVMIDHVQEGGGAHAAGVRAMSFFNDGTIAGDVIVRVDGERVESLNKLYRILEKHKSGDVLLVQLARFHRSGGYELDKRKVTLRSLEGKN